MEGLITKDFILNNYNARYDGAYSPLLKEDLESILDIIEEGGEWEKFSEHFNKLLKYYSVSERGKKEFWGSVVGVCYSTLFDEVLDSCEPDSQEWHDNLENFEVEDHVEYSFKFGGEYVVDSEGWFDVVTHLFLMKEK